MKTSTKGRARGGGRRVRPTAAEDALRDLATIAQRVPPPPKVDPCEVEFDLATPGGFRVKQTDDGDILPARWDQAFLVYPRRALLVRDHPLAFMSEEQWEIAVRMLAEGYTLGFNGGDGLDADVVCAVASHCPFALMAIPDPKGDVVVYVARRDVAAAAKGKKVGKGGASNGA